MAIDAWVVVAILFLCCVPLGILIIYMGYEFEELFPIIFGAALIVLTIFGCALFVWWNCNSESGRRALKDQEANLNGGISRTVSVYDINGDLIEQYAGKFDIETDSNNYILFDDENGKRHIIYYTTGTIIIDEN